MFLERLFKRKQCRPKSTLQIARETLLSIELEKLPNVYASEHSIDKFFSLCKTIDDYNVLLETVTNAFKCKTVLYPSHVPQVATEVYLREFYLQNGYYVDYKEKTKRFKELSLEFVDQYALMEALNQKEFVEEKLLFITANIVSNLTLICKQIV